MNMKDSIKNVYLRDLNYIIIYSLKVDYIWSIIKAEEKNYYSCFTQSIIFTYSNVTAMILFLVS